MQLGIVVVYKAEKEDEWLLNLHLNQIERHTDTPYAIYAAANRSTPEVRALLAARPRVKICDCPSTDLRGWKEHSFYLEELVRIAVEDGATHIATLHMDSFPVRSGWVHILADHLTDNCAYVSVEPDETTILFFHRDFYIRYQPRFRPSAKDLGSPHFKAYLDRYPRPIYSGAGYRFRAFSEGLSWHSLAPSPIVPRKRFGLIYGDIVFHVGSATYIRQERPALPFSHDILSKFVQVYRISRRMARAIVPARVWPRIPWPAQKLRANLALGDMSEYEKEKAELERVKYRLFEDPEKYLLELRGVRDSL